jgi:proteasome lid subunit RPN8/RPN11
MTLDSVVWDRLVEHAIREYPNECCGLLIRDASGMVEVAPIRNIQDEMHARDPARYPRTARTAYSGHPADLKGAIERAERPGCALIAFYHSHPDHAAYFSEEDVAQATPFGEPSYPDAVQIVLSVYDRQVRDVKGFAWNQERSAYLETAVRTA